MTIHTQPPSDGASSSPAPIDEKKEDTVNGMKSSHRYHPHPSKTFGTPPPDYTFIDVHNDLEAGNYMGTYGGDNSVFIALAGIRADVDMNRFHTKRSPDEFYVTELDTLLKHPATRARWSGIVTIDPLGMYASRPTISATTARMLIPELITQLEPDSVSSVNETEGTANITNVKDSPSSHGDHINQVDVTGERDMNDDIVSRILNKREFNNSKPSGFTNIVNDDRSINCIKMAIDYVFNVPGLASRLHMDEVQMRNAIASATAQPGVLDTSRRAYLPPLRGVSVYIIGNPALLSSPTTEVAVRCHDACCGSDVFGTDICTCRPYLVYAIQGCVETAKRGGVGVIAYFHKEGRSLGEVTKFRVYNARKGQKGGDVAANYFKQTESIAGIRDARFQEMMSDILLLLGIKRIDWLLSMSSDKYDAITTAGIQVMQRVSIPDDLVPKAATIEITAKISSGYHCESFHASDVLQSLRSLETIRERCQQIYELAKNNKTKYFILHLENLDKVVDFVTDVGKQQYADFNIPYHSRWRHFNDTAVNELERKWKCDAYERCRRELDLATISVLLDAGAGSRWHYIDRDGNRVDRSEALALATFDMFEDGVFSSDVAMPHRVNSMGLKILTFKQLCKGFQISDHNYMVGLHGRFELLKRLGDALKSHKEYFGAELHRPGNVLDFLLEHAVKNESDGKLHVSIKLLWQAVIEGYESIWPTSRSGVKRGDVWSYSALKKPQVPASDMVPFHKLSQWLTYSLLEPIEKLGIVFDDLHLMTGLAEYRNGGLFIDFNVLSPGSDDYRRMDWDVGSELIVEWRALTVILLDQVSERVRAKLGFTAQQFPLAKVLQMGTWTAGRLIAQQLRGDRSSPISVRSDGTVF